MHIIYKCYNNRNLNIIMIIPITKVNNIYSKTFLSERA